jgi:8-oxo-dGTP diphosphatase
MFTLPAYVGIILKKDNQVLLVKRRNTDWAAECWNFPGGLLEANETLLQAVIRETQEEVGVTVAPDDCTLVHVLQVKKGGTNTKDILGFYFAANIWHGTAVNNEPDRHSEIGWFDVHALPHNVTEHAKQALNGLQNNMRYSEN